MTRVGQLSQRSNYASPLRVGYVTKHNLALESVKRPSVLIRIDLCMQLSSLKKVVFIDKERELEVSQLNRESTFCGLENG